MTGKMVCVALVLLLARCVDAQLDTAAFFYNAKAICTGTSPALPNRMVFWIFSSDGTVIPQLGLRIKGVNGITNSFSLASSDVGNTLCSLESEGGGAVDATSPFSDLVARIQTCGQLLKSGSEITADASSKITCYRTNTENPLSGDPVSSTNSQFWATGDAEDNLANTFWQWPAHLAMTMDTKFIEAYFLFGFVVDGLPPGTFAMNPTHSYASDPTALYGWTTPLTGCLYQSEYFLNHPDSQLRGVAPDFTTAMPCSMGMNSITHDPDVVATEETALKWWFDLPSAGGGANCLAAPVIANAGDSTDTSYCANVPDGFVCPVICNMGFTKLGQLTCVDGSWSSFACASSGTFCTLPSQSNGAGISAGAPGYPVGVFPANDQICDYYSEDGAVCRFTCSGADSWGSGRIRCNGGTWEKEDALTNCMSVSTDSLSNAPVLVDAVNAGSGMIALFWSAPANDVMTQSPIIRYEFTVTPAGELSCPPFLASEPRPTGHYCYGGDSAVMTKYKVEATAVNSAGNSVASNTMQLSCPALVASDAWYDVSDCAEVPHEGTCTVRCADGYVGGDATWTCFGSLSGSWQPCRELFECSAPTNIALAADPSCDEGAVISDGGYTAEEDQGGDCTPACIAGYYSPAARLDCFDGALTPSSFSCVESCKAPNNANGLAVTCAAGGVCTVTCNEGYYSATESFSCEDEPDVADGLTCLESPCSLPAIDNIGDPPCLEGAVVDSGSACTPQCASGYYPSESSLSCHLQNFAPPTFQCLPLPCSAPEPSHAVSPYCEGGQTVASGENCTPTCAIGYGPSNEYLSCSLGTLDPATYTCEPLPCTVPDVEGALASGLCAEGSTFEHGDTCTAQCATGYAPSDAQLTCALGVMVTSNFSCIPDSCDAPIGIHRGGTPSCEQGDTVASGTSCISRCESGYTPNVDSLACNLGKLEPPFFACSESKCPAPEVNNSLTPSCVEGEEIDHNGVCTAACEARHTPSALSLRCELGAFDPSTYTCEPFSCPAPTGVDMAPTVTCAQGDTIEHGTGCTPVCDAGYVPTVDVLDCSLGNLTPESFNCTPAPCQAPSVADAPPDSCEQGPSVGSGDVCTPQCDPGFTANETELLCNLGSLSPLTFECTGNPCDAPNATAFSMNETCEEGESIAHGEVCTPQCSDGYIPTVPSLACNLGTLSPPAFVCSPSSCQLPSVGDHALDPPCAEVGGIMHGEQCTPQCEDGYQPDQATLMCEFGSLVPASFTCVPAECQSPTGMENGGNDTCVEAAEGMVAHSGTCTTACAPGYLPTVASLGCSYGLLTPSTFECEPSDCVVTAMPGAASSPCAEGPTIEHGEQCTVQCDPEYEPYVQSVTCELGEFTPSFLCTKDRFGVMELKISGANGIWIRDATQAMIDEAIDGLQVEIDAQTASTGLEEWRVTYTIVASAVGISNLEELMADLVNSYLSGIQSKLYPWLVEEGWDSAANGDTLEVTKFVYEGLEATMLTTTMMTLAPTEAPTMSPTDSPTTPVVADCVMPTIANAADPVCVEGFAFQDGETCTPQCETGYQPSESSLLCVISVLVPSTFTCDPLPCAAPVGIADAPSNAACEEGTSIDHGTQCTTRCDAGFEPSAQSLECNFGVLHPSDFTCAEMPCAVPDLGAASLSPPCAGASSIDAGVVCGVECLPGYSPTPAQITCSKGTLSTSSVTCEPSACPISVTNAADPPCTEGSATVAHGGTCTPSCLPGYQASEQALQCGFGELVPSDFTCDIIKCPVPVVDNALSPVCSGFDPSDTEFLGTCELQCEDGYDPSVGQIDCVDGVLQPSGTYQCVPRSCAAPALDTIQNPATRACAEGDIIASGGTCTPECPAVDGVGYIPTEGSLACLLGVLTPSTYDCFEGHCDVHLNVTHAAQPPCLGISVGPLTAGEVCTAQCEANFKPTTPSLTCTFGGTYTVTEGKLVHGFFDCWEIVNGTLIVTLEENFADVTDPSFATAMQDSIAHVLDISPVMVDELTITPITTRRRLGKDSDTSPSRRLAERTLGVDYAVLVSDPAVLSADQVRSTMAATSDDTSFEHDTFVSHLETLTSVSVVSMGDQPGSTAPTGPALDESTDNMAAIGGLTIGAILLVGGGILVWQSGVLKKSPWTTHLDSDAPPSPPPDSEKKAVFGGLADDQDAADIDVITCHMYHNTKPKSVPSTPNKLSASGRSLGIKSNNETPQSFVLEEFQTHVKRVDGAHSDYGDELDYPASPGYSSLKAFMQNARGGSKAPSVISDATCFHDEPAKMSERLWPQDGHVSVAIYPDGTVQTSLSGKKYPGGRVPPIHALAQDGMWNIPGMPDGAEHPDFEPMVHPIYGTQAPKVFSVPAPTMVAVPQSSRSTTAAGLGRSFMSDTLRSENTSWINPDHSGSYPPAIALGPSAMSSPCASSHSRSRPSGAEWVAGAQRHPPSHPSSPPGHALGAGAPSTMTFGAGNPVLGGPGSYGTACFGSETGAMTSSQGFGGGFHPSSQPSYLQTVSSSSFPNASSGLSGSSRSGSRGFQQSQGAFNPHGANPFLHGGSGPPGAGQTQSSGGGFGGSLNPAGGMDAGGGHSDSETPVIVVVEEGSAMPTNVPRPVEVQTLFDGTGESVPPDVQQAANRAQGRRTWLLREDDDPDGI